MSNDADTGQGTESADQLEALDIASSRAEAAIARLTEGCDASTVFGAPEKVGERTFITAATIQKMGGFGFGGGGGTSFGSGSGAGGGRDSGSGGGAGGGGSSEGRPVAVIEIGPDGVQIRPVLDFTKIGLAGIAAVLTIWKLMKRGAR